MKAKKLVQLLLLLLCVFLPSMAWAQNPDDEVVRVNTDLVVLNVTVTDNGGKYVRGLKAKDFKIFEDGKEVPLTSISNFSLQETPFASVILLDTSGSMDTRLSLARSAAIRFLDGLRDEDVAAVFKFDTKIEQLQEFSSGRDLAPLAYDAKANGMTVLNDAIVTASKALSERPEKRKAIVVLSDGLDTYSSASASKALDQALALGASIYTVDMSATDGAASRDAQSAAVLRNFAEKSGARFVATPGGQALRDAFASIAEELGHQYTIAYQPINRVRDGKWRNIEVKVARDGASVRTRKGYRAPKK
ncbi:MAG TPA: VWA domain-containing protein [Pyrinomonadaceae bacterium]|jgi:VWFA-related protein|nr:VWA domain-containing protein [Pyrinomonadaceae bacterium]